MTRRTYREQSHRVLSVILDLPYFQEGVMLRQALLLGLIVWPCCYALPAGAASFLERVERDELHFHPDQDPAMQAAIAKARASLPDFFAKARRPGRHQSDFALKVEVRGDRDSEFLWVTRFSNQDDDFVGIIDNVPRLIPNLKQGGYLVFKRDAIIDWLYLENHRMVGNATLCVLLASAPDDLRVAREKFGLDCDPAPGAAQ
ncbi:DUF2314 domain-containing protein [Rhodopseudomonas telluris]|uniref:DUF2314 domain-containing protein n=1 Tax=Rhodopseudomonas telluris TaxID=644215 RepID=A0ABV6EPJ0_9BRAD